MLPSTELQIAMDRHGVLHVATRGPQGVAFELLALIDCGLSTQHKPLDANSDPILRPRWAVDFYNLAIWELACAQYDAIA